MRQVCDSCTTRLWRSKAHNAHKNKLELNLKWSLSINKKARENVTAFATYLRCNRIMTPTMLSPMSLSSQERAVRYRQTTSCLCREGRSCPFENEENLVVSIRLLHLPPPLTFLDLTMRPAKANGVVLKKMPNSQLFPPRNYEMTAAQRHIKS